MWEWYRIGLSAGLGIALGVLFSGALAATRSGTAGAAAFAAASGAAIGFVLEGWRGAVAGGLGGLAGVFGAAQLVRGTLRGGGTRSGTAILVGVGALVVAALAAIPFVGYLEAVAVPALGARLRRRAGERYAGLRILAR